MGSRPTRTGETLTFSNIYNFIGRSGTTLLRNFIVRSEEVSCLASGVQVEWLKRFGPSIDRAGVDFPSSIAREVQLDWGERKLYGADIRYAFGATRSLDAMELRRILLFKLPIFEIVRYSVAFATVAKPILMLRHPSAVLLSSMQPTFLQQSQSLSEMRNSIVIATDELRNAGFSLESGLSTRGAEGNGSSDLIAVYTQSMNLHLQFLSQLPTPTLVIYFEDFCARPVENLGLIEEFLQLSPRSLISRMAGRFFQDAQEEGLVEMAKPLLPERAWAWQGTESNVEAAKLWSFVRDGAERLGYTEEGCSAQSHLAGRGDPVWPIQF
jgi:hypothetical protein